MANKKRGMTSVTPLHVISTVPVSDSLPFGELKFGAGTFLAVFLSLLHPRVAGQQTGLFQVVTVLGVGLEQSPGDSVRECIDLGRFSAAFEGGDDIVLLGGLGYLKRLADLVLFEDLSKVLSGVLFVDRDPAAVCGCSAPA